MIEDIFNIKCFGPFYAFDDKRLSPLCVNSLSSPKTEYSP